VLTAVHDRVQRTLMNGDEAKRTNNEKNNKIAMKTSWYDQVSRSHTRRRTNKTIICWLAHCYV